MKSKQTKSVSIEYIVNALKIWLRLTSFTEIDIKVKHIKKFGRDDFEVSINKKQGKKRIKERIHYNRKRNILEIVK